MQSYNLGEKESAAALNLLHNSPKFVSEILLDMARNDLSILVGAIWRNALNTVVLVVAGSIVRRKSFCTKDWQLVF